jgi:hypothetical protein
VKSPLPIDSAVVRIEAEAFDDCGRLKSMAMPSSTEFVGETCFSGCPSLSDFTFASSSHVRKLLDLPYVLSGFVNIPDSVEILSFHRDKRRSPRRTLIFGTESRLDGHLCLS